MWVDTPPNYRCVKTVHIVYLHGFASSPDSSKARYLSVRLAQLGITLRCPDLNEPDFSTLTVSRMIDNAEQLIAGLDPGPIALIGSSLGAFVALHLAERRWRLSGSGRANSHPIEHLALLAPAFDFRAGLRGRLGADGIKQWQVTDRLEVDHYADNRVRHVRYGLYADAGQYDSLSAAAPIPTLLLQGRSDQVVDLSLVERYSRERDYATLVLLDDGHQLQASLQRVWSEISVFLGLTPLDV